MVSNDDREKLVKRLGLETTLIRDLGRWVSCQRFYRRYNLERVIDTPLSDEEADQFLCNEQIPELEKAVGLQRLETPGCIKNFYKWMGCSLLVGFLFVAHSHYTLDSRRKEYQDNVNQVRSSVGSSASNDELIRAVSEKENIPEYVLATVEKYRPDISKASGILPGLLENRSKYLQAAADVFKEYRSEVEKDDFWFEDDDQLDEAALARFFFSEKDVDSAREKGNTRVMQQHYVERCLNYGDDYDWQALEEKYDALCNARRKGDSVTAESVSSEILEIMESEKPWGATDSDFNGLCCYFTDRDNFNAERWWANNLPETKQMHYALKVKNGIEK